MKRAFWILLAVAALVTAPVLAAPPAKHPDYNPSAEVTLKGKAAEVTVKPDWMGDKSVNILLDTPDKKKVHVDIAPNDFITLMGLVLSTGDDLEITGSWVKMNGEDVLLARQIRKQNVVISVRGPNGKPVW